MSRKLRSAIDKIGELIVSGDWIAYVITVSVMLFIVILIVRG